MNYLQSYYQISTVAALVLLLKLPSRMRGLDNFAGSVIAAVTTGWLLWPAFLVAVIKSRHPTE